MFLEDKAEGEPEDRGQARGWHLLRSTPMVQAWIPWGPWVRYYVVLPNENDRSPKD